MEERLSRRFLILRAVAVGGTGTALTACVAPGPAYYGNPAPLAVMPRGTGITDADPADGPGNGRGGYRAPIRGTGITDADPADGPGNGRGGYRGNVRSTGLTDADPSDGPGRGRGGYRGSSGRTGRTDSDPRDAPGRGRW